LTTRTVSQRTDITSFRLLPFFVCSFVRLFVCLQWNDKAISQEKIHRDSIGDFNEVWNEQEKTGSDLKKRLIDYAGTGEYIDNLYN